MAKQVQEFKTEGGGWRIKVTTASGKEFFSQEQQQPRRGQQSTDAQYLIRFHMPFDVSSDANLGKLLIYNLLPESVKEFKRNELVLVEAGYHPFEKHKELVINGTIEDLAVEELSQVTRALKVQIGDTTDVWPVKVVSKLYGPGIKGSVVAGDLINEMGLKVGKLEPKEDPTYRKGLSFVGAVRPQLEMVVRDMKSKLHISRRKVYILDPVKGIPSGVALSWENGLLAAKPAMALPSDFQYVKTFTATEKPVIYEIEALLTPKLWADSEFQIDAEDLSGKFRVIQGSHDCTGKRFLSSLRIAKVG